jgi:hypothetical protein
MTANQSVYDNKRDYNVFILLFQMCRSISSNTKWRPARNPSSSLKDATLQRKPAHRCHTHNAARTILWFVMKTNSLITSRICCCWILGLNNYRRVGIRILSLWRRKSDKTIFNWTNRSRIYAFPGIRRHIQRGPKVIFFVAGSSRGRTSTELKFSVIYTFRSNVISQSAGESAS